MIEIMKHVTRSLPTLRQCNFVLTILVVLMGVYITVSPFIPNLEYFVHHPVVIPYSGKLASYYDGKTVGRTAVPSDNRLVIPDLNINEKVLEGKTIDVIHNNGVWRRPGTSNDPEKSNMVIVGHRFSYFSPYGTFYHLDKLKVGSKLGLYWGKKEHVYEVKIIEVVPPETVKVEAATSKPRLTLYTCAPLLTAKDRLVITAEEIK